MTYGNAASSRFSYTRFLGLIRKECILISHDPGTIAMVLILPVMLLIAFGFAIQLDPKNLPTIIISYDHSPLTRNFISGLNASGYYRITETSMDNNKKNESLASGQISLAITIPPDFTRNYIKHNNPELLVEADASDPGSNINALANVVPILDQAITTFNKQGLNQPLVPYRQRSVHLVTHRLYNESNKSSYSIISGLIGVLLTMTMVMFTSIAITSEVELGTMEMLLSTPLTPTEIILGKIVPYVILGYLQLTCILIFGKFVINIPIEGSLWLLYLAATPFIVTNLMIGMIFSTLANTPMQAMQMSMFFQFPSMFLSGYVFSFFGMPTWAKFLGYCLPMTYFIRITRGILLKGNNFSQIFPNILPIIVMACVLVFITKKIFKTTID